MERTRYGLIDSLRGIAIFGVVVYHFIYDLIHFYSMEIPWFYSTPVYLVQQSGVWLFVFISGAMTLCAKKPVYNGIILICLGLLATVATCFFSPDHIIVFGILSLLGWAALVTAFLQPVLQKISPVWGAVTCFLLFLFTHDVAVGKLAFLGIEIYRLPASLYETKFLFPLGFPHEEFVSADYFAFLPWLFPFWQGYFCWRLTDENFRRKYFGRQLPFFPFMGRHSLLIYLGHQPVILLVAGLIFGY